VKALRLGRGQGRALGEVPRGSAVEELPRALGIALDRRPSQGRLRPRQDARGVLREARQAAGFGKANGELVARRGDLVPAGLLERGRSLVHPGRRPDRELGSRARRDEEATQPARVVPAVRNPLLHPRRHRAEPAAPPGALRPEGVRERISRGRLRTPFLAETPRHAVGRKRKPVRRQATAEGLQAPVAQRLSPRRPFSAHDERPLAGLVKTEMPRPVLGPQPLVVMGQVEDLAARPARPEPPGVPRTGAATGQERDLRVRPVLGEVVHDQPAGARVEDQGLDQGPLRGGDLLQPAVHAGGSCPSRRRLRGGTSCIVPSMASSSACRVCKELGSPCCAAIRSSGLSSRSAARGAPAMSRARTSSSRAPTSPPAIRRRASASRCPRLSATGSGTPPAGSPAVVDPGRESGSASIAVSSRAGAAPWFHLRPPRTALEPHRPRCKVAPPPIIAA
jgi:hypothetical protein